MTRLSENLGARCVEPFEILQISENGFEQGEMQRAWNSFKARTSIAQSGTKVKEGSITNPIYSLYQ